MHLSRPQSIYQEIPPSVIV